VADTVTVVGSRVLRPLLAASLFVLASCTTDGNGTDTDPAITWVERTLPAHPGAPGRTVGRDAVECGGTWYVVGAVFLDNPTETQDTRPAAWSSADGETWAPVAVLADTYWGRRAILNSVACSDGRIAVVGARSGGAHGNPRVTTFYLDGAGRFVDVLAVFTQYGGISATSVGPISGGPAGWLIAGNRLTGPGVWVTDDPGGFTRVEGEPGLTDDGDLASLAQAGGWTGSGWVLVGGGARPGHNMDRDPLAWTSADGLSWTPEAMPAEPGVQDVHRVVALPDGRLLAVGLSGDNFAAWLRDGTWQPSVQFGQLADISSGAPYVSSLAVTSVGVLATVSTGAEYQLWHSDDGTAWHRLDVPLTPTTAGDHALAVAQASGVLLVADDGGGARLWTGSIETAGVSP